MARRKRSRVSDFMQGFEEGYDTVGKVVDDIEMSKITKAAPETSEGFTAEQGAQLEAAAKSGQYDIGYDDAAKAYTVTPKADPSQVGRIAQQGVTDFLGQRTAGTMNEGQVDRARTLAQAGVIGRRDPNAALALRNQVKAGEREDQRWDRQTKEWDRTDQDRAREDQYRTDRERLLQESPIGQYQAVTKKYESDMAAYSEAIKAGKTPDEIGPPPERPNVQRPGPLQTMAGYAKLIEHDYKYGKLNTDGLINFQEKMGNIEKENYVKALQAAQAGGSPEQVAKAFNQAGMQIDPKNVTITKTKQANGPDLVTLNYKDEKGQAASIPVMAELEAYGQAKQVYDRFYAAEGNRRGNRQLDLAENADKRAGAAATRAANNDAQDREEKKAKADAAVALFKDRNPAATAAELEAVRRGVLDAAPKDASKYNVEMGDVTTALGSPAVDRNGNPKVDPITGKQMINRDPAKEAEFFQWMKANNITDTNKGLALYMGQKREQPAQSIATDPRAIAIRDDKNLNPEQKRKKLQELGYK